MAKAPSAKTAKTAKTGNKAQPAKAAKPAKAAASAAPKSKPAKEESADVVPLESSLDELSDFSEDESPVVGLEGVQSAGGHHVNLHKEEAGAEPAAMRQKGIIYVGQLPKFFAERELRKYFRQFGDVSRVRLSRKKDSGKSRRFGYVEFVDKAVAAVAAETMNNYLVDGEMMKVSVVENPKHNLFFKSRLTNIVETNWRARKYAAETKPRSLETWQQLQADFEAEKKQKFADLAAQGFEYLLEA